MMLEWVMEVVYMEVDKVVDEVAKIKVDKVANMVMKKEGFADLTLTIDDTCGDGWVVMGVVDMEKWNLSKKWKGAMAQDVSPVAMFLIPKTFDRQSLLLQKEELDDLDVGYDYKLRQELFTP